MSDSEPTIFDISKKIAVKENDFNTSTYSSLPRGSRLEAIAQIKEQIPDIKCLNEEKAKLLEQQIISFSPQNSRGLGFLEKAYFDNKNQFVDLDPNKIDGFSVFYSETHPELAMVLIQAGDQDYYNWRRIPVTEPEVVT